LDAQGIKADAVAGLSLGEYTALVASGALDFQTAVALVQKRGRYMASAAPAGVGKMVAVMNTPAETIEEICKEASQVGIVTPANYNTPQQIVIGGEAPAVDKAVELLQAAWNQTGDSFKCQRSFPYCFVGTRIAAISTGISSNHL